MPGVTDGDAERCQSTANDASSSRRRVTIRDVAERAEVSVSTVSHAYSGKRPISEETRTRVFSAAAQLGYTADPHARSMRTRHSGMVGLVLRPRYAVAGAPDAAETFNRLTGAIATHCLRRGVGLVHLPVGRDSLTETLPMDGCIVAHPYAEDEVLAELIRRVPVVCIDPDPDRPNEDWVVQVDYRQGMRQILARMADGGARELAMIPGTEDNAWNRAAHRVAAEWAHAEQRRVRIQPISETHVSAVGAVIRALLGRRGRAVDALCYADSSMTRAVLETLHELGRRVPDDLQLATFTDTSHSRHASPAITAMDLRHEDSARRAVDLLLARIAGEPATRRQRVPTMVTFRESTRTESTRPKGPSPS